MKDIGLTSNAIDMICDVFRRAPSVAQVILYGSRAKGNFRPESDIDLAVVGIDDDLAVAAIADALDELPLPYQFHVSALQSINYRPLVEHIQRAGVVLYESANCKKT